MTDVIANEAEKNVNGIVDMADWMSRVALETVGQTILGYSFDPLNSPHNNHYTSAIKELMYVSFTPFPLLSQLTIFSVVYSPTLFKLSIVRQFVPWLARIGSANFRRRIVDIIPVASIQAVKNMSDVMYNTAKGILQQKQKEGLTEESSRDIISVLCGYRSTSFILKMFIEIFWEVKANKKASPSEEMDQEELIGQITYVTASLVLRQRLISIRMQCAYLRSSGHNRLFPLAAFIHAFSSYRRPG